MTAPLFLYIPIRLLSECYPMFLPTFVFDIFCSRVAKEYILGSMSSPDAYAKKYAEGVGEEYDEISETLYIGAAAEIIQFLSEIEAGEDSVFYLDSFAYNRLYFSNINVERKMKPLFGSILDPMKEEEYKADVTVKNFKAFVFNLRSDPSKKAPAGWEITEDEHLAKFKELFEKTVSIFDDI